MVLAKPKSITPHTKFKAEIYVLAKEEGRAAYAVLQWVPAAVLLPDDGRDGGDDVESGGGDGDAGGQCERDGELISPIAMDQGCGLRCARAARPSAPASSPKFWRSDVAPLGRMEE